MYFGFSLKLLHLDEVEEKDVVFDGRGPGVLMPAHSVTVIFFIVGG